MSLSRCPETAGDSTPITTRPGDIRQCSVLFRSVEVSGAVVDVQVRGSAVVAIGRLAPCVDDIVVDGDEAALLPGLHDHHLHLFATAAARDSVNCGPLQVHSRADLERVLRKAPLRAGWVRGVGYHESTAGGLDRDALDRVRADVPVRLQHRGGAVWFLNSAALVALGAETDTAPGIERDATGRPTGRLWRSDEWLRQQLGPVPPPSLLDVSSELASYGVTGVTDATPDLSADTVQALGAARIAGQLRQRLVLLGGTPENDVKGIDAHGPAKIVVSDHRLPAMADLVAAITAHRAHNDRAVAVHCVTREALLLVVAALTEVGAVAGDRIEHAAVAPPAARSLIAELGLAVVTQPSMIARRGDEYRERVDAADLPDLWPFRSLLDDGVGVGCSSDAPYGSLDPWYTIGAAVRRQSPRGHVMGNHERVRASQALAGFLSDPLDPGGPPRTISVGSPADLVLLDTPLNRALAAPSRERVRMTVIDGAVAWSRPS